MGYRSTPHPATGHTPYEALIIRDVRTKLDCKHCSDKVAPWTEKSLNKTKHTSANGMTIVDIQKEKKRHFKVGGKVLLNEKKTNKKLHIMKLILHHYITTLKNKNRMDSRDPSKFKLFYDAKTDNWRERH